MIEVCEVGPRDGLQNEKKLVTTGQKVELIERLIDAGVRKIEAVSFVNPKVVPQMADAEQVLEQLGPQDAEIAGLVLSRSGVERALATDLDVLHVVVAVSDEFNRRNARRSRDEGVRELTRVIRDASAAGKPIAGILGTSFGCPFTGKVEPDEVFRTAEAFLSAGASEIVLADTTGMAHPLQVQEMAAKFRNKLGKDVPLGLHFHNTRGLGLANVMAGYDAGVTRFDASVGGLGGCPFAPKAVGNVCTEDMVHMFTEMGIQTGIDVPKLIALAQQLEQWMEKPLDGMVMKAGPAWELAE
ncbi:hydroxymethylglutaryl-CoA lyase [Alteribacillus sp. HJP-4]|uniref:hydroxymethylglutaryl-CoA lyase n=1 Tax=Alteribacillus sp. HJP-4 TaxID=2775394 RepID=UPI0035CD225C